MGRYLHTMYRITDPERSRTFYEALGFTFAGDFDIVRNGELKTTNYLFSLGDQDSVLDPRRTHVAAATATSPWASRTWTGRSSVSQRRASSLSGSRTRSARAALA
jgi:catechol 2,3-dioxygenase-like lactoylglutathione lyase family enzyme